MTPDSAPEPTVVLAPDKFKGSLSAAEVTEALAQGIRTAVPNAQIRAVPVADGGEGTVEAAVSAGYQHRTAAVTGPLTSLSVQADWALGPGAEAVVELAQASGLELLAPEHRRAGAATSRGTGEVMAAALDAGASTVVLGLGGSACSDAGSGMLNALGMRAQDKSGNPVPDGVEHLHMINRISLQHLDPKWAAVKLILASDVDNELLGPDGAVAVFGPQKGVQPHQIPDYEAGVEHFVNLLAQAAGRQWGQQAEAHVRAAATHPGAGAAGGVGFAALAVLGAKRRRGIEMVLELVGVDSALAGASLAITGEGSLDEQSLQGKAPVGIAQAAHAAQVAVVAVCGRSLLSSSQAARAGFQRVFSLSEIAENPADSMTRAHSLLVQIGEQIGTEVLDGRPTGVGSN